MTVIIEIDRRSRLFSHFMYGISFNIFLLQNSGEAAYLSRVFHPKSVQDTRTVLAIACKRTF